MLMAPAHHGKDQAMTHKEFCLWLEGFFARGGEAPTAEQWSMVGKRLH